MNPYLSVTLAMCGISILALVGTAYMAVYFNRRAKADLQAALAPLAARIEGSVDLDNGSVTGRHEGQIAEGRVVQMPGGMGRVFHTSVIDAAGGAKWLWTVSRSKEPGGPDSHEFDGPAGELQEQLRPAIVALAADRTLAPMWMKVEYDPGAGHIRLTKPMRVRQDVPAVEAFASYLDGVVAIGRANRDAQYHE